MKCDENRNGMKIAKHAFSPQKTGENMQNPLTVGAMGRKAAIIRELETSLGW